MDIGKTRFVDFNKYCSLCESKSVSESEDPCNDCLTYPTNENSTKPINFKEKVK